MDMDKILLTLTPLSALPVGDFWPLCMQKGNSLSKSKQTMVFILITKQETDAPKNTYFNNMSVSAVSVSVHYFIVIHHSSQVIVMCQYEGGRVSFLAF